MPQLTAQICDELGGFRHGKDERTELSITVDTNSEEERNRIEIAVKNALIANGCKIREIPAI